MKLLYMYISIAIGSSKQVNHKRLCVVKVSSKAGFIVLNVDDVV